MKNIKILFLISILTFIAYFPALNIFFAQDDFIFINHFSGGGLLSDLKKAFGRPEVTHWRPLHNLFFLISGNVFGKSYFGYHLIIVSIHIITGFFIYKIFERLFKDRQSALFAALIYVLHPAHFTALFWISGSAINIALLLFCISIYLFLSKKRFPAIILYLLSLLASEALIAGFAVYFALLVFQKKLKENYPFLALISAISVIFVISRFLFLKPAATSDVYSIVVSSESLFTVKYYILRTAGFVEGFGRNAVSLTLIIWYFLIAILFLKQKRDLKFFKNLIFAFFVMFVGLFPFVFIPNHLSAHYMTVPILGLSLATGLLVQGLNRSLFFALLLVFFVISFSSIRLNERNSWVIDRSNLSHRIVNKIEKENPPPGSTINFFDSGPVDSKGQYIALGEGEAINFWFKNRNYKTCFSFFENCSGN